MALTRRGFLGMLASVSIAAMTAWRGLRPYRDVETGMNGTHPEFIVTDRATFETYQSLLYANGPETYAGIPRSRFHFWRAPSGL